MTLAARIAACFLLLGAPAASAQDTLDALLDRGFVAHWLVCGPFPPDVAGGISAALARGEAPLGNTDFMEPIGGITRARPQHLLEVAHPAGKALWMRAGATTPSLDLAPFFPEAAEGVAYAAFYAESALERPVYLRIQSVLGVRVWLNGRLLRDVRDAPLANTGTDRMLVTFPAGLNLLVLEAPGARFDTIAGALDMPLRTLRAQVLRNRSILEGVSGFEVALTLQPAAQLGSVAYMPRLEHTGAFSGPASSPRQVAALTLYNPTGAPSPPVTVRAEVRGAPDAVEEEAPPIAPGMEHTVRLALPTGRGESSEAGATTPVAITLTAGGESVSFAASLTLREPEAALRTYAVPMMAWPGGAPGVETAAPAFQRHRALVRGEPAYGADFGHAVTWTPALRIHPESREGLRAAAGLGQIAVSAGYAPIDERFVGGEMLVRNLALGMGAASILENAPVQQVYVGAPAMAPQSVQVLARAGLAGLVSNLDYPGMHALAWQWAPGGQRLLHRRKEAGELPLSVADIRDMATVQTREMRNLGLPADILPLPAQEGAPLPFYGEAAGTLSAAYPPVLFRGAGVRDFFEEIQAVAAGEARIPETAPVFMGGRPGGLITLPWLTQTLARLENDLLAAESAATLAALFGAQYPGAALDHAWRNLLATATPGRIGVVDGAHAVNNTLAALREAAVAIDGVRAGALDYAARKADTLTAAPTGLDDVRPFLVFNATARPRTGVVSLRMTYETAHAIAFVDDQGRAVPHAAEDHREAGGRAMNARVRFVAHDVPAYGYRIFYRTPRGRVPPPARRDDRQIETSALRVMADPATGAIAELTNKATGENLAGRGLNQVMLLNEDTARTDGGQELWTTGAAQTASGIRESRLSVTESIQELTLVSDFAGGTLTRRMTLYEGVDRVDCALTLEGVSLEGRILAVTFAPPAEGRAPVFGERFGAIVGRRGKGTHVYQTAGAGNPGGSAHHPAHGWFAISPDDHLRVGLDAALPLAPAAIIHGGEPMLEGAAKAVRAALIGRGIPTGLWPDAPEGGDFVWSDATRFPNYNDDLPHATGMRIAVGGPEDNAFTRGLWTLLGEAEQEALTARFREAGAAVITDTRVPDGYAPVPTLVLAGPGPERAAEAARACARDIATLGHYAVPPAAWIGDPPPARAASGLAVLLEGPGLCAMERDGSMTLLLARGGAPEGAPKPDKLTFRYALVPFDGSWRDAAIPAAAQAFMRPLQTAETDLHMGSQPGALGLVEASSPQFVITAVKPAGYPEAALRGATAAPRDGMALRGYESTGRPWQGSLKFFAPVRQAYAAGLLEARETPIDNAGTLAVASAAAFNVEVFWVMPGSRFAHGSPEPLVPDMAGVAPMPGRQGRDAPHELPLDGRRFSLVLRGNLDAGDGALEVALGNHSSDATTEGIVYFTTPEGWRVSPGQVYYRLDPGQGLVTPLVLLRSGANAGDGGIVAWTEQFGATHRDVMLEGRAGFQTTVERTANQVRVQVRNPASVPLAGHAEIIALPHWWPEVHGDAPVTIAPARTVLSLAPYEQQGAVFRMPEAAAAEGATVRVVANGMTQYHPVP